MAYPKRSRPLTQEEKRHRDRHYQQRRRDKTNNNYARAYRRTSQRAVRWVQEHRPALWEQWIAEELAVKSTKPYSPALNCRHPDSERSVVGVVVKCGVCGSLLGSLPVTEDQAAEATDWIQ